MYGKKSIPRRLLKSQSLSKALAKDLSVKGFLSSSYAKNCHWEKAAHSRQFGTY